MARLPRKNHKATISRAHERSEGRILSAPPMREMHVPSTLELRETGLFVQQVSITSTYTSKPTTRTLDAREEASDYFLRRMMHETRTVRPANF